MNDFDISLINFDSIFFGGTGWNLAWQFGVTKKLIQLGFNKKIKKVGSMSGGAFSGLVFCNAANYNRGVVQVEQLMNEGYLLSIEFRKRLRYYLELFVNNDPLEDIKNFEFYTSYLKLNKFPKPEFILQSNFFDKHDLIDHVSAGCYIPFILGIEPNKIGIPILKNGDLAVDAGFHGKSIFRWSDRTLVVSPSEQSNENTIGGNYGTLSSIGIRSKNITHKELFMQGYSDASKWFAKYYLHGICWNKEMNWQKENSLSYSDFLKKNYK